MRFLFLALVFFTHSPALALDQVCTISFKNLPTYVPIAFQCAIDLKDFNVVSMDPADLFWPSDGNVGFLHATPDHTRPTAEISLHEGPFSSRFVSFDLISYEFGVGTVVKDGGKVVAMGTGDLIVQGYDADGNQVGVEQHDYAQQGREDTLRYYGSNMKNLKRIFFRCDHPQTDEFLVPKVNVGNTEPVCIFDKIKVVLHIIGQAEEVSGLQEDV